MTSSTITSSTSIYSAQALALDSEGQLAVLLLETEESEQAVERDNLALARTRFIEASNDQVADMHAEADAVRLGAYFQAGASLTAAAIQVGDVGMPPECDELGKTMVEEPWGEIGAGLGNGLSQPLGKLLGDAPAADARADAKRAATAAQQAEWQLDDAQKALGRSDEQQEQVTSWLSSQATSHADARSAIIAGLA